MKRILALILAAVMLIGMTPALAEYDEHIAFTASVNQSSSFGSFTDDPVYQHFADKFNIEYELWPVTSDTWGEKNRVWIYGGTMPDMVVWDNFNYTEYLSYVDQGLIAPLPDGWETTYPNIYSVVQASGIAEKLVVDGKTYAIPRTTMYQFSPVPRAITHITAYYRKDWAEKVGMDIGPTLTISELAEYTKKCIENDLSGTGRTIGLTGISANVLNQLMFGYTSGWNKFVKTDDGYVWGPTLPEAAEGLTKIRELYEAGLIDPDFYLNARQDPKNKFASGLAAILVEDGTCVQYGQRKSEMLAAQPEIGDVWDVVGTTTIVDDEGKWHGMESFNYWTLSIFNPEIDPKVQQRILEILDYVCTKEAQEIINMGVKDVDWTVDENGEYVVLRELNEDGSLTDIKKLYNSIYFWYVVGVLPDDFQFVNPGNEKVVRDMVANQYALRGEHDFLEVDPDYEFFVSDAKSQYSIEFVDEAVAAILNDKASAADTWNQFIETNRALWEPLLNELNAEFYGK